MSEDTQDSASSPDFAAKALEIAAGLANRVDPPTVRGGISRPLKREEAQAHASLIHELFTIITRGKTPDLAETFDQLKPLG